MPTAWRRLLTTLGFSSRAGEPPLLEAEELARWYEGLGLKERLAVSRNLVKQVRAPRALRDTSTLPARARGRLVFEQDGPQGPIPLHHIKVELWDRDLGTPDDFLGETFTGPDGAFEIRYDPADAGEGDLPDLELRFFEPQHTFRQDGRVVETWKRIGSERGPDDHGGREYDFGTLRLPYWEYDPATPLARLLVVEEGTPPTAYAPGRALAMLKAVAPIELVKRQHQLRIRMGQAPTLAQI